MHAPTPSASSLRVHALKQYPVQVKGCVRTGKRCVELGAGVGAAGLTLAALGARVTLTDRRALLPLLRSNVARNWLAAGSTCARPRSARCLPSKCACC